MAANILNIVLIIIWTSISIFLSVNSTMKTIDDFICDLRLKFTSSI